MSNTADAVLDGFEFAERVAGDVAHTTPILEFLGKRTTTAELLKLVGQVQEHLNKAGAILLDPDAQAALKGVGLYQQLFDELAEKILKLREIDTQVKTVKRFNVWRKYTIYSSVTNEIQAAYELKIDVWSKSTLAQLGYELVDGVLVPPTVQAPVAALPPQLHAPSEVTLAVDPAHEWPDDHDRVSIASAVSDESRADDAYSDTDSMLGNPWLGYVAQALARRLSSVSLQSAAAADTSAGLPGQGEEHAVENDDGFNAE
ncbi:hypothetical protein L227DRAFT_602367 [Lentinus tigrinus ALCF2SS1-6]|uniref:Uncharacterized protein n=1 Tax=Lentinus tigrinus ALCF2SS1-6 TaxID=1328759 RepID=A0A5C2S247_9APHY|nr:hypothetical protein L227DRAFT_602367 [Lentinus tigrinus ALCF2SS1-6]